MAKIKPKKNTKNKKLITSGFILLFVGIVGLLLPFMSFRLSDDYTFLNSVARGADQSPMRAISNQIITPDPNLPNIQNRLIIKSAGVDMPVFQGKTPDVLIHGGWLFPGADNPNAASGNTVIFSHRFRYLPPISNTFYHLDRVKIGDQLKLIWNNHSYLYIVKTTKVIEPTDLSVLSQTETPTLTLITCAPLFSTKQRLVVTADLIQ